MQRYNLQSYVVINKSERLEKIYKIDLSAVKLNKEI